MSDLGLIYPQEYFDHVVGLRGPVSTFDRYDIPNNPSLDGLSELSVCVQTYKYNTSGSQQFLWRKESADKVNFRLGIEFRIDFATTNADAFANVNAGIGNHFICGTLDANKKPWIWHSFENEQCVDAVNFYGGGSQTTGAGNRTSTTTPTSLMGTPVFGASAQQVVYHMQIYPYHLTIDEAELLRNNMPAMYPDCRFNGIFGNQGTGIIIDLSGYQNDASDVGGGIILGADEGDYYPIKHDPDYDFDTNVILPAIPMPAYTPPQQISVRSY